MTNSEKLRSERAKILTDLGDVYKKAEAENRDLNAEEKATFERMKNDAGTLKQRYERMEEMEQLQKELGDSQGRIVDPLQSRTVDTGSDVLQNPTATPEYKRSFNQYLRTGVKSRDLNTTTPADGGMTVPVDLQKSVVLALNRGGVARKAGARVMATSLRTTIPISGQISGTWEGERSGYNGEADADNVFTKFDAVPRKYTLRQTISEELFLDGALDIDQFVTDLFVEAYLQGSDDAYVNGSGSGSNQPNSIFSGGTDKVVVSATTVTAAEIRAHFASLPSQYRNHSTCSWIGSDDYIGHCAGLSVTPANGIIFNYATVAGQPDTLFNKPIYSSSAVTTTWAAGAEIAVLGAMNYFQIVDFVSYSMIQRLNEMSALTGAHNLIARYATDSKVLVPNAFRVMKLAAS